MQRIMAVLIAVGALGLAPPAGARGFTISDLGNVGSDPVCIQMGRLLFERLRAEEIKTTTWTVNAYGIGGEPSIDGAVICAYGPGNRTQVSVVLHSSGNLADDARRRALQDRLRAVWDNL